MIIGVDGENKEVIIDLIEAEHILLSGTTGSGKSVLINSMLYSLLKKIPVSNFKLAMFDFYLVDFALYKQLPNLFMPIAFYNPLKEFEKLEAELERSERLAAIDNEPYLIIIMNDIASYMVKYPKETETIISKISKRGCRVKMLLIIATQAPRKDVLTKKITANLTTRIAFKTCGVMTSKCILGVKNSKAECIKRKGEMLFLDKELNLTRIQGAYIPEDEIEADLGLEKAQERAPRSFSELYAQAVNLLKEHGKVGTSILQRNLRISYNKADAIMQKLDEDNLIPPRENVL